MSAPTPSPMTRPIYDRLAAVLDDPANPHGPDVAKVPLGAIGGAGDGWARFLTVSREMGVIVGRIYGVSIAEAYPDGAVMMRTASYFTPSTRAALGAFANPGAHGQNVRMETPGSRGGKARGTWRIYVYADGEAHDVRARWAAYRSACLTDPATPSPITPNPESVTR